jgi:hypothetical protein
LAGDIVGTERASLAAEGCIRRLVDAAPPLTAEQRDKLAVIPHAAATDVGYADTYGRTDAGKPRLRAS